jgi:hypothetical protein
MPEHEASGALEADSVEIRRFLDVLCEPGRVYELRALQTQKGTISGYFSDVDRLARAAAEVCDKLQPAGVYVTLNPVNADLLGRAKSAVLQGFDQVVLAILCPDQENQQVESLLLQADKLEEETGADAAAEFLKEFIGVHPLIRERYIDALATSHKWAEIAELVIQIDVDQLSRLELEHGFSACAETGHSERAAVLIKQHENVHSDNSAKMFRQQIGRRYPKIDYGHSGDEK